MIRRSRLIAIHQLAISKPFISSSHLPFSTPHHCFSTLSPDPDGFGRLFRSFFPQRSFEKSARSEEKIQTPLIDVPDWIHPSQVFANCSRIIEEYLSSDASSHTFSKQNTFQLAVAKSAIPNSGNGIFAKRSLSRGAIVSFYPGTYYPPLPSYIVSLPDGAIAADLRPKDGNEDFENAYQIHCSLGGFCEAKAGQTSNLALAHLINHPPKGISPNVISYCFYWNDLLQWLQKNRQFDLVRRLRSDIIPMINTIPEKEPWYLDPNTEEIVFFEKDSAPLVGIVFVAKREINEGEELFFDYKFKVTDDLPVWYHPVPADQA